MQDEFESLTEEERDVIRQMRAQKDREQVARAREKTLMEPGDDLSMPVGQKIVLAVVALAVVLIVAGILLAR